MAAAAGPSTLGGTFGTVVGGQFMRSFNAAGIGMTLAGVVIDGIQGEVDNGTWGSMIGLGIGGGIGAFFGGPAGAALGANIGGFLGGAIGDIFEGIANDRRSPMLQALDEKLASAQSRSQNATTIEERQAADAEIAALEPQRTQQAVTDKITDDALSVYKQVWSSGMPNALLEGSALSSSTLSQYKDVIGNLITQDSMTTQDAQKIEEYLINLQNSGSGAAGEFLSILDRRGALFAEGGIATRPSIFGEAGAEAAIPLDNGMRIPIAEVDIKGMTEIQQTNRQTAQMNSNLMEVMVGVKTSLDKFLNHTLASTQSKEQLEVLLGIYTKLESIDGSNTGILRNSKSSF